MVALESLPHLNEFLPGAAVIIITSFWNAKIAKMVLEIGGTDFVPNPIDFTYLLEVIGNWEKNQRN